MYRSLNPGAIGVKADLATAADLAARNGFAGLYVDIAEVAALGVEQARAILAKAGVRPAAFGFPLDYRRPAGEFAEGLKRLEGLCRVAQALGIGRTSTWIPSWHDELDFAQNYAFHRERLGQAAAILEAHGIRLGLEFLGPKTLRDGKKYGFIHTMDGMLQLCHDIGGDTGSVGLLFDAFHWYTAGGTVADIDYLCDAKVVDVHVNDAPAGVPPDQQLDQVRGLPGETGTIDLRGFLGGLARIGYSGPVMVEPFSARVRALPAEEAVRVTGEALRKVWQEAGLE